MSDKIDIEELLKRGQAVQFYPQGWSMFPLIIPGRDMAVVEPVSPEGAASLKSGDVVLYRNHGSYEGANPQDRGILVLHRISKIEGDSFFERGDNLLLEVGPQPLSSVIGRLSAVERHGRHISTKSFFYRCYVLIWPMLTPLRRLKRRMDNAGI